MKVLLFIDVLGSGGAQRQIVGLAQQLKMAGFEVLLLDYWDSPFYDEQLNQQQIPFKHCETKGKWNIIKMFVREVAQYKPDIVISYLENPSIVAVAGRLISRHKFKLIVSERNTSQINTWSTRLRFNLFRFADWIVPNSYSQGKFIAQHYPFLVKKTRVITNMIDTNRFVPREEKQPHMPQRWVVVGRVVEQKNPLRFIDAVKLAIHRGVNCRIDWYGEPYPNSFYEQCKSKVRACGLDSIFTFHPATKDIVSVYHSADLFVLPSLYEGFPNVLCEAMACGLPVLASNVCDNPRIVEQGQNGYLMNPWSEEDMANQMVRMYNLPLPRLKEMGDKSRRIIENRFSSEKFCAMYVQIME